MKICWKDVDSVYLDLNKHLCHGAQTTFSPWNTALRGRPTVRVAQNLRINLYGGSLKRWGFVCRSLNFRENPSPHLLRRNHVSVGILSIPRSICAFLPHCCSFNQFLSVCCHFYLSYSFIRGGVTGRAVNTSVSGSEGPRLARRVVSLDKELYPTLSLFTQVYNWVPATYCWG